MSEAYFCEGSDAMLSLESMVDKVGIRNVMWALMFIAEAKAEHLHNNWQDDAQAGRWLKLAATLDGVAHKLKEPTDVR